MFEEADVDDLGLVDPGGSSLRLAAGEDICPVPGGPESCECGKVVVPLDIVPQVSDIVVREVRIGGKFWDKG